MKTVPCIELLRLEHLRTNALGRRARISLRGQLLLLLLCLPLVAQADIIAAVNSARVHGCRMSGASLQLRGDPRLDEAARRLARGESLPDAARHAGYRAANSAAVQISNVPSDRDVQRILEQRYCAQLVTPTLREVGAYRRGADVWLVVAAPFAPPSPASRNVVSHEVLELTNSVRAHGRHCGSRWFAAAPPLVAAPASLMAAAAEHSQDMAQHDYLDHTGKDGSTPAQRVNRSGYRWQLIGENLAAGTMSAQETVAGWTGSPHHCENLMDARFTQMAVAYAVNPKSTAGVFWTQLFATPAR